MLYDPFFSFPLFEFGLIVEIVTQMSCMSDVHYLRWTVNQNYINLIKSKVNSILEDRLLSSTGNRGFFYNPDSSHFRFL